jgi:hypothetical protein
MNELVNANEEHESWNESEYPVNFLSCAHRFFLNVLFQICTFQT